MIRKGIFIVLALCFWNCHYKQELDTSINQTLSEDEIINIYLKKVPGTIII